MIPTLAGLALRRPNTYSASRDRVGSDVELAGGGLRRYTRGSRRRFTMTWQNLREDDAATIRQLGLTRGAVAFTTPTGESVWVLIDSAPEPEPVPGTLPQRYNATMSLVERGVR